MKIIAAFIITFSLVTAQEKRGVDLLFKDKVKLTKPKQFIAEYKKTDAAVLSLQYDISKYTYLNKQIELYKAKLQKRYAEKRLSYLRKSLAKTAEGKKILADYFKKVQGNVYLHHLSILLAAKAKNLTAMHKFMIAMAMAKKYPNQNLPKQLANLKGKRFKQQLSRLDDSEKEQYLLELKQEYNQLLVMQKIINSAINRTMRALKKYIRRE